jgi:hypothetical protein
MPSTLRSRIRNQEGLRDYVVAIYSSVALEHEPAAMYCLGEILESPAFRNYCMIQMMKQLERDLPWRGVSQAVFERAYELTEIESLANDLIVDTVLHRIYVEKKGYMGIVPVERELRLRLPGFGYDVSCAHARWASANKDLGLKHPYLAKDEGVGERWC